MERERAGQGARSGTTTLFAAPDVANGAVLTQCKKRHRHQEFLSFLRHIEANVPARLNGSAGGFGSLSAQFGWDARIHPRRLLTFVLDGKAKLPPTAPPTRATPLDAPEFVIAPAAVELGTTQYVSRCVLCHGPAAVAGGTAPDLRASTVPLLIEAFTQIVRGGALEARGMPRFPELTDAELNAIRHYLRARAREALHPPVK